ncbi:MAG: chemotaxis protein CheW [Pseudomonadota bacterium]
MEAVEHHTVDDDAKAQYLTFRLGEEEYAINILSVREIKSWGPVTPLPQSPPYMLGVINLRGAIVPVVDLRRRFGLPDLEVCPTTTVVIVSAEGETSNGKVVGLVVDHVSEVYHLADDQIQHSADISSEIDSTFIHGLAKTDERLVILLNLDRVVSSSIGSEPVVSHD